MSEPEKTSSGTSWSDVQKLIVIVVGLVAFVGSLLTVGGIVVGILYGYFSLQRNTADNTTNLARVESKFDVAIDAIKKGQSDGQDKLLAVITAGQERQSREFGEYAKKNDERISAAEKETRRIDVDGTAYGRGKVDNRMQEIAKVDARVDKVEAAFAELRPVIQRTGDRVEQMWGDYNARSNTAPPLINPRRPPAR